MAVDHICRRVACLALPLMILCSSPLASAQAPAAPATSAVPVGGVALTVADLDTAQTFYKSAFGMSAIGSHETPALREVFLAARPDAAVLVLASPKTGEVKPSSVRLIFFVEDLPSALGALKAAGADGVSKPVEAPGMLIAFARDPDGHLLELIERTSPSN